MTVSSTPRRIAVVICSTRVVRVGPSMATLVLDVLTKHLQASPAAASTTLELLDIAKYNLPVYDEPGIPQYIKKAEDYAHAHTRAWSTAVAGFDAFVFLTPQYNWSVPAGLKNAIDYLFNEWAHKPAAVLTYGGHGGGKAAGHLLQICHGLDMKVVEETVGFALTPRERMVAAAMKGELMAGSEEVWKEELVQATGVFDKLLALM